MNQEVVDLERQVFDEMERCDTFEERDNFDQIIKVENTEVEHSDRDYYEASEEIESVHSKKRGREESDEYFDIQTPLISNVDQKQILR